MYKKQG